MEKRVEVLTMRVGDLKTDFGNPRKITKRKRDELRKSLEELKDFGIFLIDEHDNIIAGEWDLDGLADWNAQIGLDLGFQTVAANDSMEDRRTKEMELIHYEKYDYVMIVCRHETDYLDLCRKLGIEGRKIKMAKKRSIKARAIWYDDVKCDIRAKEEESDEN